jgi:hypothetical protein
VSRPVVVVVVVVVSKWIHDVDSSPHGDALARASSVERVGLGIVLDRVIARVNRLARVSRRLVFRRHRLRGVSRFHEILDLEFRLPFLVYHPS